MCTPQIAHADLVDKYAQIYGVDATIIEDIIECESGWDETVQSNHRYPWDSEKWGVKKGEREQSYGLVQIHLPSHPTITKEQALDPEFSIEFLAKNLSLGRGSWWSCYKNNTRHMDEEKKVEETPVVAEEVAVEETPVVAEEVAVA